MATTSPSQASDEALDSAGLSVTVAPRQADDGRYGTVYDTQSLAGAVPVYFHPLNAAEYLMVFTRRWHTATPATANPGGYTAFTQDTTPGWVKVGVPSGQRIAMGDSLAIPLRTSADSAVLCDAISRSSIYLYLLLATTTGTTTTGLVSHWAYNSTTGSVGPVAEEAVPNIAARPDTMTERSWSALTDTERLSQGQPVRFTAGLQILGQHLLVFGTDSDHRLFVARKPWGRIGTNLTAVLNQSYEINRRDVADDPRWVYWTGQGWSVEWELSNPLTDKFGVTLTSQGPVSVTAFRDRTWLATVVAEGDTRLARIYTQRNSQGWVAEPTTISLGSVADGSYLDGLRWQTQVAPALASAAMTDSRNEAALLYVVSGKQTSGGVFTLRNTWGLWPITRAATVLVTGTPINASLTVTAVRSAAMS